MGWEAWSQCVLSEYKRWHNVLPEHLIGEGVRVRAVVVRCGRHKNQTMRRQNEDRLTAVPHGIKVLFPMPGNLMLGNPPEVAISAAFIFLERPFSDVESSTQLFESRRLPCHTPPSK